MENKSRITRPFQLTAPGRHAACLRNRRAGDAPAFGLPAQRLRPCSQLNGLLYGLRIENRNKNRRKEFGSSGNQ